MRGAKEGVPAGEAPKHRRQSQARSLEGSVLGCSFHPGPLALCSSPTSRRLNEPHMHRARTRADPGLGVLGTRGRPGSRARRT